MAVFQKIKEFFVPLEYESEEPERIVPAPVTTYAIRRLDKENLKELLLLNLRCFKRGENYTKHTFDYLLTSARVMGYGLFTSSEKLVGFIFVSASNESIGHITTIGIAPEHRQRGLGRKLLDTAENALRKKDFEAIVLEVRVGNFAAQNLYSNYGYVIIQKLKGYYQNGEDAYLMSKNL